MFFPVIRSSNRPYRLTKDKGEEYHTQYARWVLTCANNPVTISNMLKYIINFNFYKDNQWIYSDDLEPFLMDDTKGIRNRVRWEYNIVKPMVESYVGTAINTNFKSRAYNRSAYAAEKKGAALAERLFAHQMMEVMPMFADQLKDQYNLGGSPQETEMQFNREYEDLSETATNVLIRHQEELNRFDFLKVINTYQMGLGGIAIMKEEERDGEMLWKVPDAAYFFFDIGAKLPDLSDADWMGDYDLCVPTQLYEEFPKMKQGDRDDIESFLSNANKVPATDEYSRIFGTQVGRVPRFNVYWHDTEPYEYGYVRDQFGYKFLTRLEDEAPSDEPHPPSAPSPKEKDSGRKDFARYTMKDVVNPSELTERERKLVNEKGTIQRFKDVIRFCKFIPAESLNNSNNITLDYGMLNYSESPSNDPFMAKMPYKIGTYHYKYGELITPVDPVIKPQRLINRCLSMAEAMMNNSRGSNYFIDKALLAGNDDGEIGVQRNMNNSKPVIVDGKRYGGNIQNAVVPYDATGLKDATAFLSIIENLRAMSQNVTGINDSMIGITKNPKQLVGVQQNDITRGSLLQESFYHNIEVMFQQVYDCIGNKGRMLYAGNERKLAVQMGEDGMKVIQFTKDMSLEEMGIDLRRVSEDQVDIDANNQFLFQLLQMQLIGEEEFGSLYNRSETDQVAEAIRDYTEKKAQMADVLQQQQDQMQQQAQQQQQQMMEAGIEQDNSKMANQNDQNDKERALKYNLKQMQEMSKLLTTKLKVGSDLKKNMVKMKEQKRAGGKK